MGRLSELDEVERAAVEKRREVPTEAEWREAVEGALCSSSRECAKWNHVWSCPARETIAVLAALRPLIERLERALDASTVRLRALGMEEGP